MENDIEQPLLHQDNPEEIYINTDTPNPHGQHEPRTFWQQISFTWISPLLRLGSTLPQLHQHHLPHLPPQAASDVCGDALWNAWKHEIEASHIHNRSPLLLRALFHPFGWSFLSLGGLKFINDALNFAGPLLLNGLLKYLDASSPPTGNITPAGNGVVQLQALPQTAALAPSLQFSFGRPSFNWQQIEGIPLFKPINNTKYHFLDPRSDIFGAGCAALLALTFFFKAFLNAQFSYRQGLISAQVRAALTSVCFRQSLSLSTCQLSSVGTGRIQTLMSVDADKVLGLFIGFHELWSLPFQICIALYLLYRQVHFAFLAGLVLVLLIIPLNRVLATGIQRASVTMMAAKDQRIAIISEMLKGIKIIKASGWESVFASRVDVARKKELHSLAIRKYLDAVCVYLWAATSLLFSLGTFGLFVLLGERLTAQTVFTSLALFSVLLGPINSFPWVINGIVEAAVSLDRLSSFLTLRNPTKQTLSLPSPQSITTVADDIGKDLAIEIKNGNFQWSPLSSSLSTPTDRDPSPSITSSTTIINNESVSSATTLQDINLSVAKGSFVVVTGPVGSGKSSLFNAILGEMYCSTNSNSTVHSTTNSTRCVRVVGSTAYAAQDAWLMPGSIKENILLGHTNKKKEESLPLTPPQGEGKEHHQQQQYAQILHACALSEQELSSLARGDNTHVGDAGSTVSGGQRARIALARAVYSNADIYLLDDVLAAIDAKVAAWLIDHALLGPILEGKTVMIATHSHVLIKEADMVITMNKGKIESIVEKNGQGYSRRRKKERNNSDGTASGSAGDSSTNVFPSSTIVKSPSAGMSADTSVSESMASHKLNIDHSDPDSEIDTSSNEQHEMRAVGHVRWSIYRLYIDMQGIWAPITLISLALMQATRNGSDFWLSYWVSKNNNTLDENFTDKNFTALLGNENIAASTFLTSINSTSEYVISTNSHTSDTNEVFFLSSSTFSSSTLDPEVNFYLQILFYIAAANSIFTLIRAFSFAQGGLVAAQRLHTKLLTSILSLPASFFDLNPSGRILNRFSSDTSISDDSLPFISNIFLAQLFGLAGVAIVLCFTQPYLLLALLPITFAYRILQRYYRSSSRELRRLEAVAKSPVYTTFSSALAGGTSIRAFSIENRFLTSAHVAIDGQQRASLAALAASTWLGLRLQIVAGAIAAVVGGLAVAQHIGLVPGAAQATSAGFVGLSLTYALPITGLLNGLLTCGAETEQEMVAVERISQYLNEKRETDNLDLDYRSEVRGCDDDYYAESDSEKKKNEKTNNTRVTTLDQIVIDIVQPNTSVASSSSITTTSASSSSSISLKTSQSQHHHHYHGASVSFQNVYLQYTPISPTVLENFSLELPGGRRAGLVGRTGAGKSSAVACLLRLVNISSGQIFVDGVEIRTIMLRMLRSMIGFVPQNPFIFSGTVAENVDPLGRYSSEDITDALHKVGLWPDLCACAMQQTLETTASSGSGSNSHRGQKEREDQEEEEEEPLLLVLPAAAEEEVNKVLNLKLGEGGIGLSQGQQQMLCLARVVVQSKKLKIICLDEASAAVDPGTAEKMQKVVAQCFQGCTVIEVAHRLRSVAECDVIFVMDKGKVVETGAPKVLAENSSSLFAGMLREQEGGRTRCGLM